jgi:hypothetical protein
MTVFILSTAMKLKFIGLIQPIQAVSFLGNYVKCLFVDQNDDLWVSNHMGGFLTFFRLIDTILITASSQLA